MDTKLSTKGALKMFVGLAPQLGFSVFEIPSCIAPLCGHICVPLFGNVKTRIKRYRNVWYAVCPSCGKVHIIANENFIRCK